MYWARLEARTREEVSSTATTTTTPPTYPPDQKGYVLLKWRKGRGGCGRYGGGRRCPGLPESGWNVKDEVVDGEEGRRRGDSWDRKLKGGDRGIWP